MLNREFVSKWLFITPILLFVASCGFLLFALLVGASCMVGCGSDLGKVWSAFEISEYLVYIAEFFAGLSVINFIFQGKTKKWNGLLSWEKNVFYVGVSIVSLAAILLTSYISFFR